MGSPAARVVDIHTCPLLSPNPHVGGPILPPGRPTVLIGFLPAARMTDQALCVAPAPDVILPPCAPTVLIGGLPAARMGDMTVHGGVIVMGCFTVLIGMAGAGGGGGGGGSVGGGAGGGSTGGKGGKSKGKGGGCPGLPST